MTRFELLNSGMGSDHFTNCATQPLPKTILLHRHFVAFYVQLLLLFTVSPDGICGYLNMTRGLMYLHWPMKDRDGIQLTVDEGSYLPNNELLCL